MHVMCVQFWEKKGGSSQCGVEGMYVWGNVLFFVKIWDSSSSSIVIRHPHYKEDMRRDLHGGGDAAKGSCL